MARSDTNGHEAPKDDSEAPSSPPQTSPRLWIGYVIPMVVFLMLTALEGWDGSGVPYVWLYLCKVVVVTAALLISRRVWQDIRFEPRWILPGVLVGIAVFFEWILVDYYTPHFAFLGKRTGFNPYAALPDPTVRGLFLLLRFYGLVVMVPVMEELFWRSFLLRWLTDPDYARLPLGTFSWSAFAMVAGAFGLAHPEWLAAILCAVAYGLLLKQTRSLFACIVAHAVTNLALGLYVLHFHAWRFW